MIEDLIISPLKIIHHSKGDIFHGMKSTDIGFAGFGEAYFSTVAKGEIKGFKKHSEMVLNIVVPVGEIRFVIHDTRENSNSFGEFHEIVIGKQNYCRLTLPISLWMAFQGVGDDLNLLLNMASIEHQPDEAENCALEEFPFVW